MTPSEPARAPLVTRAVSSVARTRAVAPLLALALTMAAALAGAEARADPQRVDDLSSYSPYEQQTAKIGLEQTKRTIEPSPEGKIIEGVDFVTLEVFEKRDPIPAKLNGLVNWFHVVTKPHFVERELLFKVGDKYTQPVIEESARNLRSIVQFSVVLMLPTKGSSPDRVRMLVITKDLWSLRVPLEYRVTSSGAIEYVAAQITEINLAGTHHQIAADFRYDPDTIAFGGLLVVPRVFDSRFRFVAQVEPIINHKQGDVEGSFGLFSYQKPLFSLATEWAYGARIAWSTGVKRRYVASDLKVYDETRGGCLSREDLNPLASGIPCQYSYDTQVGSSWVTRSFGQAVKHNLTLSAEASRRVFRARDLSGYDPIVAARFEQDVLPVSDTRLGPALQYETRATRYMRVLDYERFGLQEEYQLGHKLLLKLSPSYAPLRDSRAVVGFFAGASYTVALADGLLRAYVESSTDHDLERISDGSIDAGIRVISPRAFFGRLVFDGRLFHRYENYLNAIDSLGGDTRLRGYPTDKFAGKDLLVGNLELRSRSFELFSIQIGGVLFLDAGDAFDGFANLKVKRTAGFGLRAMLPQINRIVFRADWGFPLAPSREDRERDGFPGELTVTFGQAFPVPQVPVSQATEQ